jgi:hypothetical protein
MVTILYTKAFHKQNLENFRTDIVGYTDMCFHALIEKPHYFNSDCRFRTLIQHADSMGIRSEPIYFNDVIQCQKS